MVKPILANEILNTISQTKGSLFLRLAFMTLSTTVRYYTAMVSHLILKIFDNFVT